MNLVAELRKNDGQFEFDHFFNNSEEYEKAFKYLYKHKEYTLLNRCLDDYICMFRDFVDNGIASYRPGMDYIISFVSMYLYVKLCDELKSKGEEISSEALYLYACLTLLKRIDYVPTYMRRTLINKEDMLLEYAYPDLLDRYSRALTYLGDYHFERKEYTKAFKFYKKGADFDCQGRQIVYPYYLIGINQSKVADMYRYGLGVSNNITLAKKYYSLSAQNCGKKYHHKAGDFYLDKGDYFNAFKCYTCVNRHWPWQYCLDFMRPKYFRQKFERIYNEINRKTKRTKNENLVLAIMCATGLGCERDMTKYKELLPTEPKWVSDWITDIEDCVYYNVY